VSYGRYITVMIHTFRAASLRTDCTYGTVRTARTQAAPKTWIIVVL